MLFYAGVAPGERRRTGVGLLVAPLLSACTMGLTLVDEWVASLRLGVEKWVLTVLNAPNINSEYSSFFGVVGTGAGRRPYWGLHCLTGGLSSGQ